MGFNLTRRKFLQAASMAAAAVPLSKVVSAETGVAKASLEPKGTMGDTTVVGGLCEMCFWRCQLVGKVRDGQLMKLEGNPKSIDNGTSICARGNAGVKLLYDVDRLKYPLKNVGKRGEPVWKRISWQEALDECGAKLKAVVDQHGPQGICVFPHGASAKYPMHYFERTVGTHNVSEASFFQCRGIRDAAYVATTGKAPNETVDMAVPRSSSSSAAILARISMSPTSRAISKVCKTAQNWSSPIRATLHQPQSQTSGYRSSQVQIPPICWRS
jgi:thiosulfate reductase / polysulfide reductase chain A